MTSRRSARTRAAWRCCFPGAFPGASVLPLPSLEIAVGGGLRGERASLCQAAAGRRPRGQTGARLVTQALRRRIACMQRIFRCENPHDRCHAMTVVWMIKSIEQNGVLSDAFLTGAPLAVIQDMYNNQIFLRPGQTTDGDYVAYRRQSLRFFGFDIDEARVASGPRDAWGFKALNTMAMHRGHSYFVFTGYYGGHCLGSRVHAGGWDLFDANAGLLRYESASEFRTGVRQHLMFNHMTHTVGAWVVLPVLGHTRRVMMPT